MLAKEPADRPADAAAVLAALGLPAPASLGQAPLTAPLIGREAVLGALRSASGRVVGPAGAGKSRVLAELAADARVAGDRAWLVRGRGPDAAPVVVAAAARSCSAA